MTIILISYETGDKTIIHNTTLEKIMKLYNIEEVERWYDEDNILNIMY